MKKILNKKMFSILLLTIAALSVTATVLSVNARSTNPNSASSNKIKRVLLVSIDGLHSSDLSNYVKANPNSNLSALSAHGITYSNASSSAPSDSFPGMLALATGGSTKSTGVFYDNSYDRNLLPPISAKAGDKPGTNVLYDETIDKNFDEIDGGGGINPDNLPRDPSTKKPVYPHNFLKTNTIFEVIKNAGYSTAWCDKHLAYDLLNGPSGKGIDDLYTPEIAANGDASKSITKTEGNDDLKVSALVNEIEGKDHTGNKSVLVPTLFGMNFQAINVGQKLPGNGYTDSGNLSSGLAGAMKHTDESLGKVVNELKKQNLYDSTLIIITAKHGNSPINPTKLNIVDQNLITVGVDQKLIAQITTDDTALIWLTDQSKTKAVVSKITANKDKAHIKDVLSYSSTGKWPFNNPANDSRVPDIVIKPEDGVIYTKAGKKIAEHGGFSKEDTNVALLLSNSGIKKSEQNTKEVTTSQVAPTILKALGLDPGKLQAVKKEHTKVLPDLK